MLEGEDSEARRRAACAVGGIRAAACTERILAALVSMLESDNLSLRAIAVNTMSRSNAPAYTERILAALVSMLENENAKVRQSVALAAAELGASVGIERILTALVSVLEREDHPKTRHSAALAVAYFGPPAGIEKILAALASMLESDNLSLRAIAADAVSCIGASAATERILAALASMLESDNFDLYVPAGYAVGKLGAPSCTERVLTALVSMLESDNSQLCGIATDTVKVIGAPACTERIQTALFSMLESGYYKVRSIASSTLRFFMDQNFRFYQSDGNMGENPIARNDDLPQKIPGVDTQTPPSTLGNENHIASAIAPVVNLAIENTTINVPMSEETSPLSIIANERRNEPTIRRKEIWDAILDAVKGKESWRKAVDEFLTTGRGKGNGRTTHLRDGIVPILQKHDAKLLVPGCMEESAQVQFYRPNFLELLNNKNIVLDIVRTMAPDMEIILLPPYRENEVFICILCGAFCEYSEKLLSGEMLRPANCIACHRPLYDLYPVSRPSKYIKCSANFCVRFAVIPPAGEWFDKYRIGGKCPTHRDRLLVAPPKF